MIAAVASGVRRQVAAAVGFVWRTLRFVAKTVGLLAIPAVAAGLLVVAFGRLQGERGPVVDDLPRVNESVPIGSAELEDSSAIDLELTWVNGAAVPAPAITGLVTGVDVVPGPAPKSGEWVLEVDGIRRVGYVAERPFWRPIGSRSTSAEIAALVDLLIEMGYKLEPTEIYSSAVRTTVRQFHSDAGAPRSSIFAPSMTVWLGPDPLDEIETVEVAVGRPMPGPGEPLLREQSLLSSAKVRIGDSGEGGNGGGAILGDRVFVFDDNELGFDQEQRGILTSDLEALSDLLDPSITTLSGRVQLARPLEVQTVPVSAVVVADDGTTCVVLASPGDSALEARLRVVSIVASDGGIAQLEPTLGSNDRVLGTLSDKTRSEATSQCSS